MATPTANPEEKKKTEDAERRARDSEFRAQAANTETHALKEQLSKLRNQHDLDLQDKDLAYRKLVKTTVPLETAKILWEQFCHTTGMGYSDFCAFVSHIITITDRYTSIDNKYGIDMENQMFGAKSDENAARASAIAFLTLRYPFDDTEYTDTYTVITAAELLERAKEAAEKDNKRLASEIVGVDALIQEQIVATSGTSTATYFKEVKNLKETVDREKTVYDANVKIANEIERRLASKEANKEAWPKNSIITPNYQNLLDDQFIKSGKLSTSKEKIQDRKDLATACAKLKNGSVLQTAVTSFEDYKKNKPADASTTVLDDLQREKTSLLEQIQKNELIINPSAIAAVAAVAAVAVVPAAITQLTDLNNDLLARNAQSAIDMAALQQTLDVKKAAIIAAETNIRDVLEPKVLRLATEVGTSTDALKVHHAAIAEHDAKFAALTVIQEALTTKSKTATAQAISDEFTAFMSNVSGPTILTETTELTQLNSRTVALEDGVRFNKDAKVAADDAVVAAKTALGLLIEDANALCVDIAKIQCAIHAFGYVGTNIETILTPPVVTLTPTV